MIFLWILTIIGSTTFAAEKKWVQALEISSEIWHN
jgi:hypothetical protein